MHMRLSAAIAAFARSVIPLALVAAIVGLVAPAHADSSQEAWTALRQPGAVAVMRHALAPGTGDPADFDLGDCATQRNLDDRGRAQARAIGASLRSEGIVFDRVLTSQWCRCRETAELLAMGTVEELPALNSFFGQRARSAEQTRKTGAFLKELSADARVLLVTHQVNITALTGVYPASGEIVVGRMGAEGFEVAGSIEIAP